MTDPKPACDPRRYGPICPSCGRDNRDYDNICTADGPDDSDCPASQYPLSDLLLDADQLLNKYGNWESHPAYPVSCWQADVSNDETRVGYWDSVANWLEGFADDIGFAPATAGSNQ